MSPMVRNVVILGGVAVVAAGAGALIVSSQKPATTPAATNEASPAPAASTATPEPAVASTPPAAAPQSQAPAASETVSVPDQDVASVEFTSLVQPFSLVRDTAAYVQATMDAPQMYPLKAGTPFKSVEKSKDGKWVVALTQDGQAAFLPAADVGPYDQQAAQQVALPPSISGTAIVVDTANLTVDGQAVPLGGIKGETGIYADQLQALIDSRNKQVNCTLHGAAYSCTLDNGLDVARMALYNGAAEPNDDASDDFRAQTEAAKAAHKGIWK